jgi:thiosulfate/3-mercaptopyruvate sulfurtransferase
MRKFIVLSILLLAPLAGTTAQPGTSDGLLVDAAALAARLDAPDTVLLHVGDPSAYAAVHIPGARLVPPGGLAAPRPPDDPAALFLELPDAQSLRAQLQALGIARDSRVVVIFGRNELPQATRVLYTLDAAGWGGRVALLDGGLPEWQRQGRPVTAAVPEARATALPALVLRPRSTDAAYIQANAGRVPLIDARLPAFYTGEETSRMQAGSRAGHLPGARNVPFSELTTPAGVMKSREELAAMFTAAGLKPGDQAVVYCHVGQQASAVQFAARLAGIDALLYDGSFQEWAQRQLPLKTGAEP